ncbi:MAG TPA: 1,4-alpha-glucan branching protein GlgB [Dissulfurispiraceae bacterium]|nr:1,4-alpha-glucan branching protein GlgB [Dissulfurispiraceae bacterium]
MDLDMHIRLIINGDHGSAFDILGMHSGPDGIVVRAFLPDAKEAVVLSVSGKTKWAALETAMKQTHAEGFFEARFDGMTTPFPYRLRIVTHWGDTREFVDPFAMPPVLTAFDLHLIGEGTHYENYDKLGAHLRVVDGVSGVHFAVWAPNARRVSLVGDFNSWDNRRHPMRLLGVSGIWEIFVPGIGEGEVYKFDIFSHNKGYREQKADPFAFHFEVRPKSGAIVWDITKHRWSDGVWMEMRRHRNWFESPISTYEVHLGSWMRVPEDNNRFLTYRELAERLIPYVRQMGFTHIELLPVTEHPFDASWGYQTLGYFAPTSRFGRPEDFMYFIDQCHQNDIGVIMDWVPAHFPRDAHGLGYFDGTCLYEHEDPRKGAHRDWGTLIFNYGRNEVINYLISNALFWIDRYHIDGLRVDAVASMLYLDYSRNTGDWVPNEYGGNENLQAVAFIKKFNEVVHGTHPGVLTIAEESTAWPGVSRPTYLGGLGFSMKWNMGWMHDTLRYFSREPVFRKYHSNDITFSMLYSFTENFVLPFSHDEVVHGKGSMLNKMPGDTWQKFANLRTLYGYMYGHPGKKILFMGLEWGQWDEWNSDKSLDWHLTGYKPHRKLQRFLQDLNAVYRAEPALFEIDFNWKGFEWIDFSDAKRSVLSFIRRAKDPEDFLVFVFNNTPVPRMKYLIGVPRGGFYRELLNSDSSYYGGSNLGNAGLVVADRVPMHGREFSISLTLPPLSCMIFKPQA